MPQLLPDDHPLVALARRVSGYRDALLRAGIPNELADDLVRAWHQQQIGMRVPPGLPTPPVPNVSPTEMFQRMGDAVVTIHVHDDEDVEKVARRFLRFWNTRRRTP